MYISRDLKLELQSLKIGFILANSADLKGDISRFFIFHYKILLYVGFYVFIKNPDHFSTIFSDKMSIMIFFKLVRFVNKISTGLFPLNKLLPFAIGVSW